MAIYKDKKRGTYYVSVYIELNNGERKRILKRGFESKKEAKKAEASIILDAEIENPDNPFLNDVIDDYIEWYEKRRKASSLLRLKTDVRLYIKPFFKNKPIQDIKKRDVMKFHDFLLDKLSITSAKHSHGYLSAILNHAIKMEYTTINVAREVGGIKGTDHKKFDYWTIDDFKVFYNHIDDLKYQALFMTFFNSGLRVGELLGLTWQDIDFNSDIINVDKNFYNGKIGTTKTESSTRKIKLPKQTMHLLKQYKLQSKPKTDYYIFGEYYTPLSRTTLVTRYNKYREASGVKRIRLHDFRHSHASYLINNGYDIQIVSKRLGHSKVSITLDIYAHLYPNKEDEAISQMDDDFKGADVIKLIK